MLQKIVFGLLMKLLILLLLNISPLVVYATKASDEEKVKETIEKLEKIG